MRGDVHLPPSGRRPLKTDAPDLASLGWSRQFDEALGAVDIPEGRPFRVVAEQRGVYRVRAGDREVSAAVTGRFRHRAGDKSEYPAVGDWVVVRQPEEGESRGMHRIEAVLPRRTVLARPLPSRPHVLQVLAANVDLAFIVTACDRDFSERRLERYVTVVAPSRSGIEPVVVLNKVDLVDDPESWRRRAARVSPTWPVLLVSALEGAGLDQVRERLPAGTTAVLLGSSGAGKSTIVNRLLGAEVQKTAEVRARDRRGRHTTRTRQLFDLPGGGMIIDTPGIRELQLAARPEDVNDAFPEIAAAARHCAFQDCRHEAEPKCAVRRAREEGRIAADRLASYHHLRSEIEDLLARAPATAPKGGGRHRPRR